MLMVANMLIILFIVNIIMLRILAKEVANTRKAIERMYTAKANISSVETSLQTSISMIKMQVFVLVYLS